MARLGFSGHRSVPERPDGGGVPRWGGAHPAASPPGPQPPRFLAQPAGGAPGLAPEPRPWNRLFFFFFFTSARRQKSVVFRGKAKELRPWLRIRAAAAPHAAPRRSAQPGGLVQGGAAGGPRRGPHQPDLRVRRRRQMRPQVGPRRLSPGGGTPVPASAPSQAPCTSQPRAPAPHPRPTSTSAAVRAPSPRLPRGTGAPHGTSRRGKGALTPGAGRCSWLLSVCLLPWRASAPNAAIFGCAAPSSSPSIQPAGGAPWGREGGSRAQGQGRSAWKRVLEGSSQKGPDSVGGGWAVWHKRLGIWGLSFSVGASPFAQPREEGQPTWLPGGLGVGGGGRPLPVVSQDATCPVHPGDWPRAQARKDETGLCPNPGQGRRSGWVGSPPGKG